MATIVEAQNTKPPVGKATLTGDVVGIQFENKGWRFAVKNFSDAPIYVSFEEDVDETTGLEIPAQMCQVIGENAYIRPRQYMYKDAAFNTVYIKGTGKVEVDMLCSR